MKKVCCICFLFLSWVLGLRAAPAYEGMFCSFSLSSGNMLSFHIFQGVGLAGMKVKAQPFQVRAYSASVTCVDVEGKEHPVTDISSAGYFALPSGVVPARFVLSADGYASRTLDVDFAGNRFFYSTVLLKDLPVLEKECKNAYSPYLLRMLAQCYEDGYLTQKDTVKADSLRRLADRLYADELSNRVGIVYDGTTGKPLSSVKVTYLDERNKVRVFTSDAQGEFPLCKSRFVKLSADGFMDRTITYAENELPIPFITTLQKKGNDIKRLMKSDPERARFWTWQQALCYLEGYGVKESQSKALDLFCEFGWDAGTTIYLDGRAGAPYIEDVSNKRWYAGEAADQLSYYALRYRAGNLEFSMDYPEFRATCYFWAGVLGDYVYLYYWKKNAVGNTARKCTFLVADHDLEKNSEAYSSLVDAGKLAYEDGNRQIAGSYEKAVIYFENAKTRLEKDRNYVTWNSGREISGALAFYLSKCYRFGRGVTQDVARADALLNEASEKGWDEANSLDDLLKELEELEKSKASKK